VASVSAEPVKSSLWLGTRVCFHTQLLIKVPSVERGSYGTP